MLFSTRWFPIQLDGWEGKIKIKNEGLKIKYLLPFWPDSQISNHKCYSFLFNADDSVAGLYFVVTQQGMSIMRLFT